jgi:hypothetical protein
VKHRPGAGFSLGQSVLEGGWCPRALEGGWAVRAWLPVR